jgi:hypothetical protein
MPGCTRRQCERMTNNKSGNNDSCRFKIRVRKMGDNELDVVENWLAVTKRLSQCKQIRSSRPTTGDGGLRCGWCNQMWLMHWPSSHWDSHRDGESGLGRAAKRSPEAAPFLAVACRCDWPVPLIIDPVGVWGLPRGRRSRRRGSTHCCSIQHPEHPEHP